MKNFLFIVIIVLSIQVVSRAQNSDNAFNKGSWELNFTGSLGSLESTEEFSSLYYIGSSSNSESRKYFQLGIIPAYYLVNGLAFEPELNILAMEKTNPAFLLLGNLAYTLNLKSAHFFPFIRAGYGITNSLQIPVDGNLTRYSHKMDIGVLNLGVGLKTLLTESILLRSEINYRKFSYSEDDQVYNYKLDLSSIALIFGFSVLL